VQLLAALIAHINSKKKCQAIIACIFIVVQLVTKP